MFEEVTDSRRITVPETSSAPSSLQELVGDWLMQVGECSGLASERTCEVRATSRWRCRHGRVGITQPPEGRDERVKVSGEQVFSFKAAALGRDFLSMCPLLSG